VFLTMGLVTMGLVTMGGGSALAKTVRRSLGIPDDWPLSPVFTDELVRLSVQGFLAMSAAEWRVVEARESTPGRHARYVGVAVGRTRPHDALAL
jgi:hypothetical protein